MWDLIVSVPDHCLSFYFENIGLRPWFQHLPRDLVNVNEWKIMFDPHINNSPSHMG